MPDVESFLRHFGLWKHSFIGDYKIVSVTSTHEPIIKNQQYEYAIALTLVSEKSNSVQLLEKLKQDSEGLIYSQFGNPYHCYIENYKIVMKSIDEREIHVTCRGYANRLKYIDGGKPNQW